MNLSAVIAHLGLLGWGSGLPCRYIGRRSPIGRRGGSGRRWWRRRVDRRVVIGIGVGASSTALDAIGNHAQQRRAYAIEGFVQAFGHIASITPEWPTMMTPSTFPSSGKASETAVSGGVSMTTRS